MNTNDGSPPPDTCDQGSGSDKSYKKRQELQSSPENQNKTPQINECSTSYPENKTENPGSDEGSDQGSGLSQTQQQFVLRFCRQLASVIEACEQSESAEIEVGRRHINSSQVKVKLQAEREFTSQSRRANDRV